MVLIPVIVVVAVVCFYRALYDTLVSMAIHLIMLSLWSAGLLFLCVEGLGLDSSAFLDWFHEVYSQEATYTADSSDEAISRDIFCIRTLSTDSPDSLGTQDTITTTTEPPSTLTQRPIFSLGSGGALGTSGTGGNDFMAPSNGSFRLGSLPSSIDNAIVGSYTTTPTISATPGALNSTPKFNFRSYGQIKNSCSGSSGFMVPPSGYFRFGSFLSSSNGPDVKVSAVPDIPSLRRIVRAKCSPMPDTISESQ